MVYKFFNKNAATSHSWTGIKFKNQQLGKAFHKTIIIKLENLKNIQKKYSKIFRVLMLQICSYKSKDNKGIRFLLCLIDIFSKCT